MRDPQPYIVHADHWAQIPKGNPVRRGYASLVGALAAAKRVVQSGGNNAHDTVRVYERPAGPAMLLPKDAVAFARREGRRIVCAVIPAERRGHVAPSPAEA